MKEWVLEYMGILEAISFLQTIPTFGIIIMLGEIGKDIIGLQILKYQLLTMDLLIYTPILGHGG